MDALHTLTWRVAVRELKALRQTNPEVPLATCLDEEEEPVVTPSAAAESPRLDGQEVWGLPQSWGTPTQAWGSLPVWMGPYPPQGMWAAPIQVWALSSDVEAAPLQVVEAAPIQAVGDAPTQEVGALSLRCWGAHCVRCCPHHFRCRPHCLRRRPHAVQNLVPHHPHLRMKEH